ncbi:MAG: methyltransferase domain-containing protein [Pseudomonadota bacterium]|uniref:Methyltransferase type 12 n=1 Tax=Sphingobium xenophagum TaxID=121428 RepID=A0A249MRV2_SPHXE|nr:MULTISPECIES: methyltransferase domain-containing protein [Sphingobium]ASY44022.1 methyltransferase type 12 [Sphingobium xenophagum]OUC55994.1 methyltransferase type 12 [Sphingobium sp. GW456-12-10-14-TSB1]QWT12800.1 methyltransferase domain-containing protein [Sphingobium xenophagum]
MKRSLADEQMDAADLPANVYAQVLADLDRVNRVTMAARPTLAFLDRAVTGPFRLLDVGYGDGGMLRQVARWAKRRGMACELVGIDLNPRSQAVAQARTDPAMAIDYRTGDYAALAHEPWDILISSLVTHHMDDAERLAFLRFMEDQARMGWFVNDLHRHGFAYHGYPWLARLLRVHPIVRADGQLSIARSFVAAEWRAMLDAAYISDARIARVFPFRLCVSRRR